MKISSPVLFYSLFTTLIRTAVGGPIRGLRKVDIDKDNRLFFVPSRQLMMENTEKKSNKETLAPTTSSQPSLQPSFEPSNRPSESSSPVSIDQRLSYCPGDFSNGTKSQDDMLLLSNGLSCKRIATSGEPVSYANGTSSSELFHDQPDGAAVFEKADSNGYYYVSNSEIVQMGTCWNCGGVGAIEFANNGDVIGYKRIASNLRKNCGGGKTPWNSWVTCEETKTDDYVGQVYQVDPTGNRPHELTAFGKLGLYESFAYDTSTSIPRFFVTRDASHGVLTRFTPNAKGMECFQEADDYDRWCTLKHGEIDYLELSGPSETGTFVWTKNETAARISANTYFPNAEGIDSADGTLFVTSKTLKRLVILDLAANTYVYSSTVTGAFDNQPDQVGRLVHDDESILYFCEDGGSKSGVFGRNIQGRYYTILEGRTDDEEDETTGLAWSPDALHMYVTYQQGGFVYDCTRDDGMLFHGATLDIKYHAV